MTANRESELMEALTSLRSAFINHRTATHRVEPKFCVTCAESDIAIEHARLVIDTTTQRTSATDEQRGE